MDPVKEIAELKAEREALKKQLVSGISEQERIAIHQRIIAVDNQITELYKLVPHPSPGGSQDNVTALSQIPQLVEGMKIIVSFMPMVVSALTPNPWSAISQTARPDSFLKVIADNWVRVNPSFPNFCCVLQSVYSASECKKFDNTCQCWMVGAHIIPHSYDVSKLGHFFKWNQEDVDSPQNGLPLCKELEVAFDMLQWCLNYDQSKQSWVIEVVDDTLSGRIVLTNAVTRDPTRFQIHDLTWDNLRGQPIRIADVVSRKALIYHAHFAVTKHKKQKDIALNYSGDKTRSNSPEENVRQWLSGIYPG